MKLLTVLLIIFGALPLCAGEPVEVEKQKVKLALEYENFIDTAGSEIKTSGIRASYMLKMKGDLNSKALWALDFQTGAKTNLDRTFESGDLSPLIWSNRINTQMIFPFGRFYAGGGFYFRNKWLANSDDPEQFVDIFGGLGFQEIMGTFQAGAAISEKWDVSGALQRSSLNYDRFPLSNSDSTGTFIRLSRRLEKAKINFEYRMRQTDFARPIFPEFGVVPLVQDLRSLEFQHDLFQEAGVGVEFFRPFYFSGGYYYQNNDSNNPGFSFNNHRINLLIGTEISEDIHFQAYGIIQNQDFSSNDLFLQFPILIEESETNTMAASLTKSFNDRREIEIGFQRLINNSSFEELEASKYILYAAYNWRF